MNHWMRVVIWLVALAVAGTFARPVAIAQTPSDAAERKRPQATSKPGRYWTTQWSFEDVDIATLTGRLERIGIDFGVEARGTVTVKFDVGIPLTDLRNAAAYRFDGTLQSKGLVIGAVELNDLSTTVTYRDGIAKLKSLKAQFVDDAKTPAGVIRGDGSVQLVPRGDVRLGVNASELTLSPLMNLVRSLSAQSAAGLPESGIVAGDVSIQVPLNSVDQITSYKINGKATGSAIRWKDLPRVDATVGKLNLNDGVLRLSDMRLSARSDDDSTRGIEFAGDAQYPLTGSGPFRFKLAGNDVPTGVVASLIPGLTGEGRSSLLAGDLDFMARGSGELSESMADWTWDINASLASPAFTVAGIDLGTIEHDVAWTPNRFSMVPRADPTELPDDFRVANVQIDYRIEKDQFTIDQFDAEVFGGRVRGSVKLPSNLDAMTKVGVSIDRVQPTIAVPLTLGLETKMSARLSGTVDWEVPVGSWQLPSLHRGKIDVKVSSLVVGSESIGELDLQASAQEGVLSLTATGRLLDGDVQVTTLANADADTEWNEVGKRLKNTSIRWNDISIDAGLLLATGRRSNLTGSTSGTLTADDINLYAAAADVAPMVELTVSLSRLTHRSSLLAREVKCESTFRRGVVEVRSIAGDYAGGFLKGSGQVYLLDREGGLHPRADLRLTASRVDLTRGLWFLGDVANDYQGKASGQVTITGFADAVRVRGSVDGRDLVVFAIPIGKAHSGLEADTSFATGRWSMRLPAIRSVVSGGLLNGEVSISSTLRGGRGVDLESRWRTNRVDFFRLSNQLGKSSTLARGEITGEVTLGGKSVQSVSDLAGRFRFRLGETRGGALPGIIGVSRFLGPVSLATERFKVGEARGLVGGGAVIIDEFWLASDAALVRADGQLYLNSLRLDLNVLVATGDYREIAADFSQIAGRFALQSLIPASAIVRVSELLRDRTLVVGIGGTVRNPIVRVRPVETFREEAVRFLIREGQRLIMTGVTAGAADSIGMD